MYSVRGRGRGCEAPGYEGLHGVAGLGVRHCVDCCLLAQLLLAPPGALLSVVLLGGRCGRGRGRDVRDLHGLVTDLVGDLALSDLWPGLALMTGLLLLTLGAVGEELGDGLAGDKCILVSHLQQ